MGRRRSRQVEIFNFSFLDILACTIGLLIFIMVMVFILQSGSPVADAHAIVEKSSDRASEIRVQAQRDDQIADQLEAQLGQIHTSINPQIVSQRESARLLRDAARALYDQKTGQLAQFQSALQTELKIEQESRKQKLAEAQARLEAANARLDAAIHKLTKAKAEAQVASNVHFLPHAQSRAEAARFNILHLDCRAREIILFEVSREGAAREIGRSPKDALGAGSDFSTLLQKHRQSASPLVLLWVRPDGIQSFEQALAALPAGMEHGYEPADADWKLTGGGMP